MLADLACAGRSCARTTTDPSSSPDDTIIQTAIKDVDLDSKSAQLVNGLDCSVIATSNKAYMAALLSKLEACHTGPATEASRVFQVDWELIRIFMRNLPWNGACIAGENASGIPKHTVEAIRKRMTLLTKRARLDIWTRPKNNLSPLFNKQGGWQSYVLKVHQALAAVLYDEDFELDNGQSNMRAQVISNSVETLSLLTMMQKVAQADAAESGGYGDDMYHEYHQLSSDNGDADESDEVSPQSDRNPKQPSSPGTFGQSLPNLYVALPNAVWMNVSGGASINDSSQTEAVSDEVDTTSDFCLWTDKTCLLVVDADYVSMAVSSTGRFDAYLWAIFAAVLQRAGQTKVLPVRPPEVLGYDWSMTLARAAHGFRVFRDATGPYRITQAKYEWYVTLLTSGSLRAVQDTFHDLANEIWHAQFNKGDTASSKRLEKLLIALLGHENDMVRSQATVFLNNLYDQHDWQQDFPFLPVVRCVGDRFTVEVTIDDNADPRAGETPSSTILIMTSPSFEPTAEFEVYSYHFFEWRPAAKEADASGAKYRRFISKRAGGKFGWVGKCDFGEYPRCGYYDWRVVKRDPTSGSWEVVQSTIAELKQHFESSYSFVNLLQADVDEPHSLSFRSKSLWPELGRLAEAAGKPMDGADGETYRTLPLQGRFIVHPRTIRNEQMHEVFTDQQGATLDDSGVMVERGSFSKVASGLSKAKEEGITAIMLGGALARDNGDAQYTQSGEMVYERPDASPFAATCRASPCHMLGGVRGFNELMREAHRLKMKILVDTLARVSSSRAHRKYWQHILHTIDEAGKRMMLYGTDGRSMAFEESCQLNYRKVESWDLLIEDIEAWYRRMGVNGVKIDNAHLLPQIMQADEAELNRLDPDGQTHYSPEERLMGEIVLPSSDSTTGFWSSTAAESHWPNPLLVRLSRDIWRVSCDFIIVGDCGMLETNMVRRVGVLSRSGIIPQMQSLPETLSRVFGKRIGPDG